MPPAPASAPVQAPFQGYFNDRPPHAIPPQGISAGNNYRVRFNQIWFKDMGWVVQIPGANSSSALHIPSNDTPSIMGGGLFTLTTAGWQYLIIVTGGGDIYAVNFTSPPSGFVDPTLTGNAVFITPTYNTGTISNGGSGSTAIVGAGTAWATAIGTGFRTNARAGDYLGVGSGTLSNPAAPNTWFRIVSITDNTHLTIAADGQTIPNIPGGTSYTIRQRLIPNLANSRVSMESFPNAGAPDNQDLLFIADGGGGQRNAGSVDPIVCWNPTVTAAIYMSGFSFSAKKMRRFNNVMIYGDLWGVSGATPAGWLGSTSIQTSDNGLPKTFATAISFQGVVSDGAEPIQYLGVMGNQLLIYTGGQAPLNLAQSMSPGQGGSVISASFVGAPTVWQFATVIRGRGTIGQGLVAEFADRHQFLGQDGEYRYNGMFLQMMNDHVFRGVLATIDWGNLQQAFNIIDPQAGEIMWVLPTQVNGTNNIWATYVEHYAEQANNYLFKPISIRDAGDQNTLITWQCFLGAIPNSAVLSITGRHGPLIGDSSGNVIQIGLGAGNAQTWGTNAASSFNCTATFAARIVAGERARGLIKRVYPFVDEPDSTSTTLTVELDLWDRVGAAPSTTDTQTYTTGTATRFTTHYRRGRVAQVKFTLNTAVSVGVGLNLVLDGYDWDLPKGSPGGQR